MKPGAEYLSSIGQKYVILLIAISAIAVRLIPLWRGSVHFAIFPGGDSDQYRELAEGLRHGCGFARLLNGACTTPEILRTPGYPLLLTMQSGVASTLVVQSVMAGAICWLVAHWLERRWNLAAALVAEAAVALDMPSVTMANLILSDALFQLLLVLAVLPPLGVATREYHPRNAWLEVILAAIASAFAILTRPIAILLPITTPLPLLFSSHVPRRNRFAFASLLFMVPTAVTSGWVLRNYAMTGYCGLSTISSVNLYLYRAADIIARSDHTSFEQAQRTLVGRLGLSLAEVYDSRPNSADVARQMMRLGKHIVVAHPREALIMTFESTLYMAAVPDRNALAWVLGLHDWQIQPGQASLAAEPLTLTGVSAQILRTLQSPLLTFLVLFQGVLIGFTWLGMARALSLSLDRDRDYRLSILYLAAMAILFIVLAAGAEATVRFRMPIVPLLAIVMGLGYFPEASPFFSQTSFDTPDNLHKLLSD
jgi:hypothetical protein